MAKFKEKRARYYLSVIKGSGERTKTELELKEIILSDNLELKVSSFEAEFTEDVIVIFPKGHSCSLTLRENTLGPAA